MIRLARLLLRVDRDGDLRIGRGLFVGAALFLAWAFWWFLTMPAHAQAAPEQHTFTLYRNSATDANMRVHVATFDAKDGEAYNRENCDIAAGLFRQQLGVTVKYWCEKGRYRR